jgi:Skp family chaperone for outer membrane proteins
MKKHFFILVFVLSISFFVNAQKGVRIGYIDMEYILQNVPDYTDAKNQLEEKAQKWKQEIETKKNEIKKLQDALETEKVLLTKELYEERAQEIKFQESELTAFQEKRFGPNGDVTIQKIMLVKPIQDQVFNAVQDIAEAKRYDFIFDKSSDLTMIFSAKRYDISDQVVRVIKRAGKREELTKKQQKDELAKEKALDAIADNPNLTESQRLNEEKKLARKKLIDDKLEANALRKKEFDENRQKKIDERNARKNGTIIDNNKKEEPKTDKPVDQNTTTPKPTAVDKQAERTKAYEERVKALEEKKAKNLAEREAAKKLKEEEKLKKNLKQ